ncbi:hypothetical protein IAD21_03840 [Abditibacteriota bacterium]|nr:hypothetical protein IAD21_03840 [Abditibacteriota bacterium]
MTFRRWSLLSYIWNTPWLLAVIIVLVLAGIALWVWSQMQEAKEGDEIRHRDRGYGDSVGK